MMQILLVCVFSKATIRIKGFRIKKSEQNLVSENMRKQIFTRIRKTLAILVLVSLITLLTAASASASTLSDYQNGYKLGFQIGYKVGYNAGNEDCLTNGKNGVLTKIPVPTINKNWNKSFTNGHKVGFKKGFIAGYNKARFKCLE